MDDLISVISNIGQIVRPEKNGLDVVENGGIAIEDGQIKEIGPSDEIMAKYSRVHPRNVIHARQQCVLPGFIDAHTHALFAGDRSDEFEAKLKGKTYQQILADGGGILRTVRATREATDEKLLNNLLNHLDVMLAHGTTTVEVKSGYGLDTDTERRMLEILDRADSRHPVDVIPTYLGAHAVPEDKTPDEYVKQVINEQIPAVAEQGIAEFCDVFCEEDVFSVEQSRNILTAANEAGLKPKIHAEEFTRLGGARLGAELGAVSADHLLHANESDVQSLQSAGVVPVLLPGTAFGLDGTYADADTFLAHELPLAIATDFNPNCYSHSMSFAISLACMGMKMTPAQALVAATRNAALALDRPETRGMIEVGTPADLIVLEGPNYRHLPYNVGINNVKKVIKGGELVYTD